MKDGSKKKKTHNIVFGFIIFKFILNKVFQFYLCPHSFDSFSIAEIQIIIEDLCFDDFFIKVFFDKNKSKNFIKSFKIKWDQIIKNIALSKTSQNLNDKY